MPLYRLHEILRGGSGTRLPMNSTSRLAWVSPECIAVLLAKKRISVVEAPPLSVLPGFEERAAEYEQQGILDVHDLVDAKDVPEEDVEEAKAWSVIDGADDWMSRPISEDVTELTEVDDDELVV